MPEVVDEPFDPKKIYEDLISRCMEAKAWYIRCIVDESFVGYVPFDIIIENGVFNCRVVAPSLRDAYIEVANKLPVIKFLKYDEE